MDISTITDIKELKVLMSDEFLKREQAVKTQTQATANINTILSRIAELEAVPAEQVEPITTELPQEG